MRWSGEYRINANDIDVNNIVSASGVLRYMQDAANSQMEEDGLSYSTLVEEYGLAFVLSKLRMSLYAPLYSHDRIIGESWACLSRGVTFLRCHRILRGDEIIAEAVSSWALVGVTDRKLHRVGEIAMPYGEDAPLELDSPSRLKIPSDIPLSLVGERTVEYADIDSNGHMNNTKYPDILCGYLGNMHGQRVISLHLHFQSEAPLGETVKVYHGEADGTHYLRTLREDGSINAEAEVLLEDME